MLQRTLLDHRLGARRGAGEDALSPAATGERLIGRLAGLPIYPPLLAIFPILALFAQNAREVRAVELIELLACAVLGAGAAWLVLGLVLKDAARAALVLAAAIVMFYALDRVIGLTEGILLYVSTFWIQKSEIKIAPLWIILPEAALLCGFAVVVRRLDELRGVTRFLNLLAVIAVGLPAVQILTIKAPVAARQVRQATPIALGTPLAPTPAPDIYYIILDGYARHDVMKSHFGFDNTGFLEHLERKGFYVARSSTANYCQTPLCLSSSLNATYLDDLVKGLGNDQTQLSDLIGNNNVLATLRPLGYQFVTFATGFEPTEHPEADRYLSPYPHSTEFQRMVIDMTPARVIWPDPRQMDRFRQARERINYLLDHLPDVARDPRPTFTFAHLLCPHPPIIFGPDGEDIGHEHEIYMFFRGDKVNGRFRAPEHFRRAYRDQAAYITRRIQETIDRILAESPEPPIIIVQSDHGSELNLDMEDVHNTDQPERMSVLNAYYFPGGRYEGLYQQISPVNSFRVVFNTFFGARLPLLPDRSFFSTWSDPYRFIDVTDSVRSDDPGDSRRAAPEPDRNPRDS
jgi:hypothetical protein